MKRMIMVGLCIVAVGAVGMWISKRNQPPVTQAVSADGSPSTPENIAVEDSPAPPPARSRSTAVREPAPEVTPDSSVPIETISDETRQLHQSVDQLISSTTSFQQKYSTWIKLRDEGKLPQVIAELEQRATNNPASAEYPAALGQAYIHQITATKDTRQYAVLGLKADQSFDTALEIDPANWEARFFKALAMSYWPAEMNQGSEVINRFTQLIQDQETQPAQPHFAQAYVWLGEQYQKTGRAAEADQVWRRGAALFPSEPMLQQKLTAR